MKTKLLATVAAIGGLVLAATASAQIVGGAVGGAVGGNVGGAIGAQPGAAAGASGAVNAGAGVHTPPVTTPSVSTPATPSVNPPLPSATPSVTTPSASASVNGSANANANAAAASTTAPVNLTGLAPGMAVRDAKGRALGKVSRVVKRADGTISAVEVAAAQQAGKTMSLEPSTLSVSSGVVTYSNTSATTPK